MFKRPIGWFLIATLALQLLVPTGFMLDLDAAQSGSLRLTICSSGGTKEILVNVGDGKASPAKSKYNSAPQNCPFSLAHAPAISPSVFGGLLLFLLILQLFVLHSDLLPSPQRRRECWPRGPPLLN